MANQERACGIGRCMPWLISALYCPSQVAGDSLCPALNLKSFLHIRGSPESILGKILDGSRHSSSTDWNGCNRTAMKSRTVHLCLKMATEKLGNLPIPSPTGSTRKTLVPDGSPESQLILYSLLRAECSVDGDITRLRRIHYPRFPGLRRSDPYWPCQLC